MQVDLIKVFNVPDSTGTGTLRTEVRHHVEPTSGYELFSITQQEIESEDNICVLLSREQLAELSSIARGH